MVWRGKLVAELRPGVMTETEVARIERGAEAGLADLGLRLNEAKQLTAALQAEMVSAQLAVVGERRRGCATCGRPLASKGHYRATFRSLLRTCKIVGGSRRRCCCLTASCVKSESGCGTRERLVRASN